MSRLMDLALDPKQLHPRYQPIVDCQDPLTPIVTLECLIRGPQGTNLFNPAVLFEYARRKRFEHTLDLLAFRCFLGELSWLCDVPFSINFHASTLSHDREVVQQVLVPMREAGINPGRMHIELIESTPEINVGLLLQNLADLRKAGVRLALDDFGVAHANLHLLGIVQPEIVKIDRSLLPVDDSDRNAVCFLAAVRSARTVGARIVAEGIETASQFEYVRSLGVTYAQGFYFHKPLEFNELEDGLYCTESADTWTRKLPN
jgi:EAL domain-containing protein (putative c-di-GMP-specific phosphodiesterase class I)